MAAELQAIQIHLWVLTGLLTIILFAAGYCNYSRVKQQKAASPFDHMKDLWERERFAELRDYTSSYLKTRPNTANVLMYHAMVSMHFKDYDEARSATERMARALPQFQKTASSMIEVIDARMASQPSRTDAQET